MNTHIFYFLLLICSFSFAQDNRQLADSLYYNDHFSEARDLYEVLVQEDPGDPLLTYRLGYVNYRLGNLDRGIELIKRCLELNNGASPVLTYTAWSRLAKIYSLKNEKETALFWLEKAVEKGYNGLKEFEEEPHFDSIRETPKFQELKERLERKTFPCRFDSRFKAFDFWVGEWEVYASGTANKVGYSLVQKVSEGCAILENWSSLVTPHTGKSLNYYNSDQGFWEQFWQGSRNDRQYFSNGHFADERMQFDYTDTTGRKGKLMFYKLADGSVRQYSETETEKGSGQFVPAYDLTYKRKL